MSWPRRRSSALVAVLFLLSNEALADDLEEARTEFIAGQQAAAERRWADAVESFRRSYQLSRVPAALFNLCTALRALGRHKEARDGFDRLLEDELDEEMRAEARKLREEVAARVATVALDGMQSEARHGIRIDGRAFEDGGRRPLEIEVDPGPHTVQIELAGFEPFTWNGTLGDGQRSAIEVIMVEIPKDEGSSFITSPIFWVVVGVVVAGGATATAIVLQNGAQLDPASERTVDVR